MTLYDNYWFNTYTPTISHSLSLPDEVDIAIVGGGFGAITLLFQLLRHKFTNVILLEEHSLGFKNTGRSLGQITLTGGQKYFSQFRNKEIAKEYLELTLKSIRQLNKSFEILNCDYRQRGGLHLAKTEDELQFFKEELDFLNENDVGAILLDSKDINNFVNLSNFFGGLYIPCESTINPYKIFHEAKNQLKEFNKCIFQNAKVEYVDDTTKKLELLIEERGVIKANKVVYCNGTQVAPFVKNKTQQIFHQIIVSEKRDFNDINITCDFNSTKIRSHDGRILLEGISKSKKIFDNNLYMKQFDFLDKNFGVQNVEYITSYNELISKDSLPLIGEVGKNQYIMSGYDLSQSCLAGAMMYGILIGKDGIKSFAATRDI